MRRPVAIVTACVLALAVTACSRTKRDSTLDPLALSATTTTVAARPTTTTSTTTSTTTTSTTTTTTTSTTTTTVPPTLPTPIAPPPEDGSTEPLVEIGAIEIPKFGLRSPMYEGIRMSTLDRGPGHWPGTAMPGQPGNVVVAGHRVSYNAEFRRLDELVAGDEVILASAEGRFVYRVRSVEIVPPDALWIVEQTPARTATLFACHPPGSVRERIVAHLELAA
jgi:sortase A